MKDFLLTTGLVYLVLNVIGPLVLAQGDDVYWDDRFNTLGLDGTVLAIAVSGIDVYVGGTFTMAGGVIANKIAKWDGSAWSAMGSGISGGNVSAIAVSGSNVYAGGNFTSAGGVSVNNIAKWNGSSWSALGTGTGGDVRAIAFSGSDVFVGGFFWSAGGISAVNNIARWNGTSWSALVSDQTSGVNSTVNAITIDGNNVYVGGSFNMAGGQSANNIALWNGSAWSILGSGVSNGDVNAIVVIGSDMYAGGVFNTAGGVSANKIARWNGSNWSALGTSISGGNVNSLTAIGPDLFAGGTFTAAGGVSVNEIAHWDGSNWSALGSGISGGPIFAQGIDSNSDVYVAGSFDSAGVKISQRFAMWKKLSASVPVELISFSAQSIGDYVELRWETATEANNYGFELERMLIDKTVLLEKVNKNVQSSGTEWKKIAFVAGNGTTNEAHVYSFTDNIKNLSRLTRRTLLYRLKQIDLDGTFEYIQPVQVNVGVMPNAITLGQNFPNPFNAETTIEFVIPESNFITLKIYNMLGQEVRTLVYDQLEADVAYQVKLDASHLPSGVYYYTLHSGNNIKTKKMSLTK